MNAKDERARTVAIRMAESLGDKVTSYSQVEDIMNEAMYKVLSRLIMYRYPVI